MRFAMEPVSIILACLCLPLCIYLGLLAVLARRERVLLRGRGRLRFAFVVPAHNEAAGIAATVRSLKNVDYPPGHSQVYVVADNCTDDTAERARAAGAVVWEREDQARRGKGYALELAFAKVLRETDADAVVVVDADTIVSANLLHAFEARLCLGAAAVQADYGVRNVEASWRTRLMALGLALFHRTRSLARERLRLSAGLRGNGMCFSRELIERHPHQAYSVVEDVEYGIQLGLNGVRVAFAEEASVLGEMASRGNAAVSQRRRWEGGRLDLLRRLGPLLLRRAVTERDPMLLDLAFDLVVPPLSTLALWVGGGLGLELLAFVLTGAPTAGVYFWAAAFAALVLYVGRGLLHSGLGPRGVLFLLAAPAYVAWRLVALRGTRSQDVWVRTRRESE